jgi:hypothetical protein
MDEKTLDAVMSAGIRIGVMGKRAKSSAEVPD